MALPSPGERGAGFELAARRELERAGLRLRAANVRYRFGELDLVMDDADVLVFVEVRYRRGEGYGGGAASVDGRKRRRLARAAAAYLAASPALSRRPCRFDVIEADGDPAAPRLHWLKDAVRADN